MNGLHPTRRQLINPGSFILPPTQLTSSFAVALDDISPGEGMGVIRGQSEERGFRVALTTILSRVWIAFRSSNHPGLPLVRSRRILPFSLPESRREEGVVLIALLWLLVALSLLAMNLASETRVEAGLARSSGDAERAYFLARGTVEQVIYKLSFPDKSEDKQKSLFPFSDGMNHFWLRDGEMICHVAIMDEGGKLDLNHASDKVLMKLLGTLGLDDAKSQSLAKSIVEWREPDKSSASQKPDNPASTAKHQTFTSIEELLLVDGMSREILYGGLKKQTDGKMLMTRGLAEFVTVYSDRNQINLNYVEPEVLASLPDIDMGMARLIVDARKMEPFDSGSTLSQRVPGMLRGETLSMVGTNLSKTYCLVATAFPIGSKLRRSIMTVVRINAGVRARHERLIWYDEYWPSQQLLNWIDVHPISPTFQAQNMGNSLLRPKEICS